jgi:hypothetical protein
MVIFFCEIQKGKEKILHILYYGDNPKGQVSP